MIWMNIVIKGLPCSILNSLNSFAYRYNIDVILYKVHGGYICNIIQKMFSKINGDASLTQECLNNVFE